MGAWGAWGSNESATLKNLIPVMRAEGGAARVATVTERFERAIEREAPSWGIQPFRPNTAG